MMAYSTVEIARGIDIVKPFCIRTDLFTASRASGNCLKTHLAKAAARIGDFKIRYHGFTCLEESTELSGDDEIYCYFISANWERVRIEETGDFRLTVFRTTVEEDVSDWDWVNDKHPFYRYDLYLWGGSDSYWPIREIRRTLFLVQVIEHDYSDISTDGKKLLQFLLKVKLAYHIRKNSSRTELRTDMAKYMRSVCKQVVDDSWVKSTISALSTAARAIGYTLVTGAAVFYLAAGGVIGAVVFALLTVRGISSLISAVVLDKIAEAALDDLAGRTYQIAFTAKDLETAISQGSVVYKSVTANGTDYGEGRYKLKFSLRGRPSL